jgi:hypothetical protein
MLDPLSITGLVLQITTVPKQLYGYGQAFKGARKDIVRLRSESYALNGVLEDIQAGEQEAGASSFKWKLTAMLGEATEAPGALETKTRPQMTKASRALQSMTWPLGKQDCNEIQAKPERYKTWFML